MKPSPEPFIPQSLRLTFILTSFFNVGGSCTSPRTASVEPSLCTRSRFPQLDPIDQPVPFLLNGRSQPYSNLYV